jgi:hypothetical protein
MVSRKPNKQILSRAAAGVGTVRRGCCLLEMTIPPNNIAMVLTPTGYEDKIYTPGQVDMGTTGTGGQGNQLVLIQSSGFEIKEQFLEKDKEDGADHRCTTGDHNPITLDVRLVLALPDWTTPEGRKAMKTLFALANPQPVSARILAISAASVYADQAKLQVRSFIRKICAGYKNFNDAFDNFSVTNDSMTDRIRTRVGQVLHEKNIPLQLVDVQVSNMKPDETVMDAQLAKKAAEARVEAIQILVDYLDQDPTGTRRMVYKWQVIQEIIRNGNAAGHNTIFMTDVATAPPVLPVQVPVDVK